MHDAHRSRLPRFLVTVGFGSTAVGSAVLSVATFQTQTAQASALSGPGPITLTFTHVPSDPAATIAFIVLIASIPVWSGYLRWRFYLSVVAPAIVALGMVVWIYQDLFAPYAGSIIVSSATWVFLGLGLVFLGCAFEIAGVLLTRHLEGGTIGTRSPVTSTSRTSASRPR